MQSMNGTNIIHGLSRQQCMVIVKISGDIVRTFSTAFPLSTSLHKTTTTTTTKNQKCHQEAFYCWPLSSSDGGASLLTLYFLDIFLLRWSSQRERMTATVVIESITTKDTTSPATTAETDEPLEAKDQRE